jgi:GT2 family glycosyltransferase
MSSGAPMKISVVICTRDRPDTVGQAVESVAECDYPNFDMHVMDQSTNELTREIVVALAKRFEKKCTINYHHLDKAGLSRAYNAGIRVSDGGVIACTDDDVIVPTDWIAQAARAFDADPEAGLLYGQVLVPESLKQAEKSGTIIPSLLIPRRDRLAKRGGSRFRVFGMGANMAIRRTVLERVLGFDEALGGGGPLRSSQDYDFAYRVYRSGMAVLLEPDVKVDHYGTRTQEQWPGTLKAYGIGDGAFYSKHIRCGDPRATWLFATLVVRMGLRQVKRRLEGRPRDEYGANLFAGVRDAWKFGIDREFRIYRETGAAKMTVTDANAVTATKRR